MSNGGLQKILGRKDQADAVKALADSPLGLSKREIVELACAIARGAAIICDIGKVGREERYGLVDEDPYIWDIKEGE